VDGRISFQRASLPEVHGHGPRVKLVFFPADSMLFPGIYHQFKRNVVLSRFMDERFGILRADIIIIGYVNGQPSETIRFFKGMNLLT